MQRERYVKKDCRDAFCGQQVLQKRKTGLHYGLFFYHDYDGQVEGQCCCLLGFQLRQREFDRNHEAVVYHGEEED